MKRHIAGRFGLAAAAVLCILSLSLPYCYGKGIDRYLRRNGSVWSVQPGTLSAAGQENPLVYALYRNRFLGNVGIETSSDVEQTGRQLLEKTEALTAAGALSQQAAEKAREILANPEAETSGKIENGFVSATYLVVDEEKGTSEVVQASWQENTGLVTFYSVTANGDQGNLEDCLEAYRIYLGVETLPDWIESSGTEQSVCSWSQAGQLYLFCQRENGRTMLSASSRNLEGQEVAP